MARPHRKYTREQLADLVACSSSVAEVLRRLDLNQAGGTHAHISRAIKGFGLDTSHFVRHQGGGTHRRRTAESILVRTLPGSRRTNPVLLNRALLDVGRPYRCGVCSLPGTWWGRPLRLEIDHIDGDYHNNEAWNLRFICPNCHAQTDSFSGRSKGKYARGDDQLALFGTVAPPAGPPA